MIKGMGNTDRLEGKQFSIDGAQVFKIVVLERLVHLHGLPRVAVRW